MPSASIVFSSITELFGLFALGWLIRWKGYAKKEDFDTWGKIAAEVFYPFLIFHSIIRDFDPARVKSLWVMPALAFGLMFAGAVVGLLVCRGMKTRDPATRRTFVHLCAMNNFIYLPIFIIQNSLPPGALADFFVFNLGSTIGFWTIGIFTLGGVTDWRRTLRHLISPPLLSMFLAIGLAWSGARGWLPASFLAVCRNTGSLSVPLMLIIIGATLQGAFRRDQTRDLVFITVLRLVVLPILYIAIIKALPLPPDLELLAVIVALMPTSAVSPVMARLYGGVPAFASAATLVTHLASLVTVPLAFWWLSRG
ncbi:MAG: hypothetical protein JWL81_758 [Verrucomicrobiales bacterium]|nr:hypothetical protein [Verrucomicrobiales bacterium]